MIKFKKIIPFLIILMLIVCTVTFAGTSILSEDSKKEYIYENIDEKYIKKVSSYANTNFDEAAHLTLKNTYIDYEHAKNIKSIDKYFDGVHDKDSFDGYVMTARTLISLYDINDSSEYVVGFMNLDEENEIIDVVFAENNDEGKRLYEIYDYKTGLVYVKKQDLYKFTGDEILVDYVQAQALHTYKRNDKKSSVKVYVESDNNDIIEKEIVRDDVCSPRIVVPLMKRFSGGDISSKISKEDLDIRINGDIAKLDNSLYDIKGNDIVIEASAANVSSVEIDMNDSFADKARKAAFSIFSDENAYAYSTDTADSKNLPTWKGYARVGDYCEFVAKWNNSSGKNDNPSTYDALQVISGNAVNVQKDFYDKIIAHDKTATEFVIGEYEKGKSNVYKPSESSQNTYRDYKIKSGSITPSKNTNSNYFSDWLKSINSSISMSCVEVLTAASVGDGNIDFTAMVSEIGSDYILITFCSKERTQGNVAGSGYGQVLCGTFAVKYSPENMRVNYYCNGGSTTADGYTHDLNGLIYKDGKVYNDDWKIYYQRNAGLVNAGTFGLKRNGYSLTGYWNTKPDGSGKSYDQNDSSVMFTTSGKISLYAMWSKSTGNINFDLNGGVWPNNNHKDSYVLDYYSQATVEVLEIKDEPKKEGYAFMGWSDAPGGMVIYDFGDVIKKAETEPKNMTLYAVWKKATCTDSIWSEYGSSVTYLDDDINDQSEKIFPIARHHYYIFDGYYTSDGIKVIDANGAAVKEDIDGIIENGTFVNPSCIKLIAKFINP